MDAKPSPMEQLAKLFSQGADSNQSPSASMQSEDGGYDKAAKQNNQQGSPDMAEQAGKFISENPELLAM